MNYETSAQCGLHLQRRCSRRPHPHMEGGPAPICPGQEPGRRQIVKAGGGETLSTASKAFISVTLRTGTLNYFSFPTQLRFITFSIVIRSVLIIRKSQYILVVCGNHGGDLLSTLFQIPSSSCRLNLKPNTRSNSTEKG